MDNLIDLKTQAKLIGFFRRLDKEFPTAGKYKLALMMSPREWEYLQTLKKHVLAAAETEQLGLEADEEET